MSFLTSRSHLSTVIIARPAVLSNIQGARTRETRYDRWVSAMVLPALLSNSFRESWRLMPAFFLLFCNPRYLLRSYFRRDNSSTEPVCVKRRSHQVAPAPHTRSGSRNISSLHILYTELVARLDRVVAMVGRNFRWWHGLITRIFLALLQFTQRFPFCPDLLYLLQCIQNVDVAVGRYHVSSSWT